MVPPLMSPLDRSFQEPPRLLRHAQRVTLRHQHPQDITLKPLVPQMQPALDAQQVTTAQWVWESTPWTHLSSVQPEPHPAPTPKTSTTVMIAQPVNGVQQGLALRDLAPVVTTMIQGPSLLNGIHVLPEDSPQDQPPTTNATVDAPLETTVERAQPLIAPCARQQIMSVQQVQLRERSVTMEAMLAREIQLMPLVVTVAQLEASALVQHLRPNVPQESHRSQTQEHAYSVHQVSSPTHMEWPWGQKPCLLLKSGLLREILKRETA